MNLFIILNAATDLDVTCKVIINIKKSLFCLEKSNALKPRLHEQVLSESHETQPGANSTVNCPEVPLRRSIFNVTCSLCKVCGQNHRLSENHEYVYENVSAFNVSMITMAQMVGAFTQPGP